MLFHMKKYSFVRRERHIKASKIHILKYTLSTLNIKKKYNKLRIKRNIMLWSFTLKGYRMMFHINKDTFSNAKKNFILLLKQFLHFMYKSTFLYRKKYLNLKEQFSTHTLRIFIFKINLTLKR